MCTGASVRACVEVVVCVPIPVCVACLSRGVPGAPGSGQGLASRPRDTLRKEKGQWRVGWHDHRHHGCVSL